MKRIIGLIMAGALLMQPVGALATDSQDTGVLSSISFDQLKQEVLDRNLTIKSTADKIDEGQNKINSGVSGLKQLEAPLDANSDKIREYFEGTVLSPKSTGVKAKTATKSELGSALTAVTALTGIPIDQSKLPDSGYMLVSQDEATKYAFTIAKDANGKFLWMPNPVVPFPEPKPSDLSSSLSVVTGSVDTSTIKEQMVLMLDYLNFSLLNLYQSQLMSIEAQIQSLNSDDNGVAEVQQSIASDQIVWGAQQLYLTYNDLSAQADNLLHQLKVLQDQLTITKLQVQLGMATATDVKGTESKISDLAYGLHTLNENRNWIKGNLNTMLGQDFDTALTLAANPTVAESEVKALDYDTDLDKAIAWNKEILLKVKSASDTIPNSVAEDIQNMKLKTKLDFDKAYQGLNDKLQALKNEQAKLALEQEKLDQAQLSYNLGLLAGISLEGAKIPYENQKLKVSNAQTEVVKAYQQYQWLLQGTDLLT
ncbi:MAG: TolC family protein [Desulfitobacteriaceae bacterium]